MCGCGTIIIIYKEDVLYFISPSMLQAARCARGRCKHFFKNKIRGCGKPKGETGFCIDRFPVRHTHTHCHCLQKTYPSLYEGVRWINFPFSLYTLHKHEQLIERYCHQYRELYKLVLHSSISNMISPPPYAVN